MSIGAGSSGFTVGAARPERSEDARPDENHYKDRPLRRDEAPNRSRHTQWKAIRQHAGET